MFPFIKLLSNLIKRLAATLSLSRRAAYPLREPMQAKRGSLEGPKTFLKFSSGKFQIMPRSLGALRRRVIKPCNGFYYSMDLASSINMIGISSLIS